jgi:hypothetical protein
MSRDAILATLRALLPELRAAYGVTAIGLFGSAARGEAEPESDIDVLVDLAGPLSYFDLATLEERVAAALGASVDVVPRHHLQPRIRTEVERDLLLA